MPTYEGIAILGFPRSGTTLLRRILDAHSRISCPGETYLLSACAKFLSSHRVVGGVNVGVESGLALMGVPPVEIIRHLREWAISIRSEPLKTTEKQIWAEKTATDVFHLEGIERIFGDHLRFVCISRHGLDAAVSVREWCERSEAYPPELHPYVQRHAQPLEAFADAWVDVEKSLESFVQRHPQNAIKLRYEDLVADTSTQVRRILGFLEVDWEDGLIERAFSKDPEGFGDWKTYGASNISADSIGRWKKLSRTTIGEMAPIVNPMLESLGYNPVPLVHSLDSDEALRRYQLGLKLQQAKPIPPQA